MIIFVICFGFALYILSNVMDGFMTGEHHDQEYGEYTSRKDSPIAYWFGIVIEFAFALFLIGFGIYSINN